MQCFILAVLICYSVAIDPQISEEINKYVIKVYEEDARHSGLEEVMETPIEEISYNAQVLKENPILTSIIAQGKFKALETPKARVQWQAYKDCLFVQKKLRGKNKPKRFHVVPEGLRQLKLGCEDVCMKPTTNSSLEWFFMQTYGMPQHDVVSRENAIVFNKGKNLFLNWLTLQDTGCFVCKYEGIVFFEHWLHVEPFLELVVERARLPSGNDMVESGYTVKNEIITFPEFGIRMLHSWDQWSNCSHMPYGRSFLRAYKSWSNLVLFSVREMYQTRFRGCMLQLDSRASAAVKSKFNHQHSVFRRFEDNALPCKTPFMKYIFKDLIDHVGIENSTIFSSILQEKYCESESSFLTDPPVEYTEVFELAEVGDNHDMECKGALKTDQVTWTKDGYAYEMNRDNVIKNVSENDFGKYTCWVEGVPLASTMVTSDISHRHIKSHISAWGEKLLAWLMSLRAFKEVPILAAVVAQGKFKAPEMPKAHVQWQAYKDCLYVQKKCDGKINPKCFTLSLRD
ncbi:hypothetical protein SK128_018405 [Halocaridina rubra]|uniref:Ig-like domain-containing protein n=1 Tax=Halocaridina rubra TaxID=373956 RepID=A0AAN9A8T7_HALRR